jgi:6-phosphogluconate dehydrogenase
MIGGEAGAVKRLDPVFTTLSSGAGAIARTVGRENRKGTAERGYLHCVPSGAGHFVKMVHNGVEYGLMAAYAEGLGILRAANVGAKARATDAETTPLRDPEHYQYDFDLADITELWRRGSVISSWLLDLTATALAADPALSKFEGRVSDSGEGRWTIKAAIDEAVPVPVLTGALYERFSSGSTAQGRWWDLVQAPFRNSSNRISRRSRSGRSCIRRGKLIRLPLSCLSASKVGPSRTASKRSDTTTR